MNQKKQLICQVIAHEGEGIQGFRLNLGCQDSRAQFCLQCGFDSMKRIKCKKDLKGFVQIQSLIPKFNQQILDFTRQLNKFYSLIKTKYEEFSKQLEKRKIQLLRISEVLAQQNYQQIKEILQVIREQYSFSNYQEETIKQNQIGNRLQSFMNIIIMIPSIRNFIQILDLDKGQQSIKCIIKHKEIMFEQELKFDPNFVEDYTNKGHLLKYKRFVQIKINSLKRYADEIVCLKKPSN